MSGDSIRVKVSLGQVPGSVSGAYAAPIGMELSIVDGMLQVNQGTVIGDKVTYTLQEYIKKDVSSVFTQGRGNGALDIEDEYTDGKYYVYAVTNGTLTDIFVSKSLTPTWPYDYEPETPESSDYTEAAKAYKVGYHIGYIIVESGDIVEVSPMKDLASSFVEDGFATKTALSAKVDKESGKSLVSNELITKLQETTDIKWLGNLENLTELDTVLTPGIYAFNKIDSTIPTLLFVSDNGENISEQFLLQGVSAQNRYYDQVQGEFGSWEARKIPSLTELSAIIEDLQDINAVIPEAAGSENQLVDTATVTTALSGKQDTLSSGTNIKTIQGSSILGSGNLDISPFSKFQNTWPIDTTLDAFLSTVWADSNVKAGLVFLGSLRCQSGLPDGLENAEVVMEVLPSTTAAQKVLHLVMTSGTTSPYRWELSYYVLSNVIHNSGWISYQLPLSAATTSTLGIVKVDGTTITVHNDGTISAVGIPENPVQSAQVQNILPTTQAAYDALEESGTVDENTLYLIPKISD